MPLWEGEERERERTNEEGWNSHKTKLIEEEDHKSMAEYYNIMLCQSHKLMFPIATKRWLLI